MTLMIDGLAMNKLALIVPVALILTLSTAPAHALRCGNRLVSKGDTQAELLAKCGEPTQKGLRREYAPVRIWDPYLRDYRLDHTIIYIEEWIYNFGPHRFMQSVQFQDGRVERIESLNYGY